MPIRIEEVIARIPQWTEASSVAIAVLPGGVTNSNYRVDVDGESFVVRIGAENAPLLGIDRNREYQCTVAASRTGVGPKVVHFLPDVQVLVTRFIPGRSPSADEMVRPEMLERLVESMRRYHRGPRFDGVFSPFRSLEQYLHTSRRHVQSLPDDIDDMYRHLAEIKAAVQQRRVRARPCHNDLWGPNLIDDGALIRIVDWEYAGMGDVFFDLANFAIHVTLSDTQEETLLRSYFGNVTDNRVARLNLMKIVAELREAMWCMVGLTTSHIEFDFAGYAMTYFDRYRQALDDARVPAWFAQAAAGA